MKKSNKRREFPHLQNEGNHKWKGDKVSKTGLHKWLKRKLGDLKECAHCGARDCVIDIANIDHQYKRNTTDYIPLCRGCHRIYDYYYNPSKSKRPPQCKLTEKEVIVIRQLKNISKMLDRHIPQVRIGEMFGVSGQMVSDILNRKLWKHV